MSDYIGNKIYMTIKETNAVTGLSISFLRKGVKAGTIPHIMSGNVYMINVPKMLETLEQALSG